MAALHARCFTVLRPWSQDEFATILEGGGAIDLRKQQGFLVGRVIADEAELLTVAVAPDARRQGVGAHLTQTFLDHARKMGAATAFLEVAADNEAACALYGGLGFVRAGVRKGYYAGGDAIIMSRSLSAEKTD
ncbi:MAG: GNAT family N-acetyltransferase [Litoreibacter sp.]|nr:GNAT family N-acetyltransferase [Litoreibacter sp.]